MQGGIIDKDMPIHVSNLMLVCGKDGPVKVGYRFDANGKKSASAASAGRTCEPRQPRRRARVSRRGTSTRSVPRSRSSSGSGNVMEVPRLEKIVLNCGVGRATQQASLLDGAVADLTLITGQKPLVTRAKKSIAGFKLREGNAIGAKVTLRGDRMWEFYDRLVSVAIPRIRDFRGLNPNSFDGRGNYTFGVTEQLIFPEIDYDKIDTVRGMDITIVTTGTTDDQGRALLRALGFPFRRDETRARGETMAKKALVQKQQRTPKFKVRGYTRCRRCGRARSVYTQLRPLPDLLPRDGPRGRGPRRDQGIVVRGWCADDDRPDRRHAHSPAERQHRVPRRGAHAVLEAEGSAGADPRARGLHRGLRRWRTTRRAPARQLRSC